MCEKIDLRQRLVVTELVLTADVKSDVYPCLSRVEMIVHMAQSKCLQPEFYLFNKERNFINIDVRADGSSPASF
jgi:hypothetical protein